MHGAKIIGEKYFMLYHFSLFSNVVACYQPHHLSKMQLDVEVSHV